MHKRLIDQLLSTTSEGKMHGLFTIAQQEEKQVPAKEFLQIIQDFKETINIHCKAFAEAESYLQDLEFSSQQIQLVQNQKVKCEELCAVISSFLEKFDPLTMHVLKEINAHSESISEERVQMVAPSLAAVLSSLDGKNLFASLTQLTMTLESMKPTAIPARKISYR